MKLIDITLAILVILIIYVVFFLFYKKSRSNFETFQNKEYKIPFHVYQTWKSRDTLTKPILKIIEKNKKLNPEFTFHFYNDQECDAFIQTHFSKDIYQAYQSINPVYGACRADFFRYCLIYEKGGIYLDIKSYLKKPIRTIIQPDDTCILDLPRNNFEKWRKNKPTYEQWLLMYAPKHPYLKFVIDSITKAILNKQIPTCLENVKTPCSKQRVLFLTGPDAYSKYINEYIQLYSKKHRTMNINLFSNLGYHNTYKRNLYKHSGSQHYSAIDPNIPILL